MRRCTACFKYFPGQPTYCPNCGRSFNVRLCGRGHVNPRHVNFCLTCGSGELSTPGPPEPALSRLSRVALVGCLWMFGIVSALALTAALFQAVTERVVLDRLAGLALMAWLAYWASSTLPGPVRKVGRRAGRKAFNAMKRKRD